jgi:hypothetical protein
MDPCPVCSGSGILPLAETDRRGDGVTYAIPPDSPKRVPARTFGRELVRALGVRGIPRSEIHRATGIGRTTLDNYRTGTTLPRTEAAAAIADVLAWPRLLEIVREARTRACRRCARPFRNEGGNMGAKRYCSVECREIEASEKIASRRTRQAGQTDDGRRRYQALARLRSGIRIAEERATAVLSAVEAMCAACEPGGACRTADCPLRAFSPLPLAMHDVGEPRTLAAITAASWTPARRAAMSAMTRQLHRDGRIPRPDPRRHPAAGLGRDGWIAAIRASKARKPNRKPLTPAHRAAIAAGHARRRAAEVPA